MKQYDKDTARRIVDDIGNWSIERIEPSTQVPGAWNVTIGSAPRIVGDLLPSYDEGSGEGVVMPLQPREGAAEFDETVLLRRSPSGSDDGDGDETEQPGVVMWGMLTCAYESRDLGTFNGTIAFYDDDDEATSLMGTATASVMRLVVTGALGEIDAGLDRLEGNGAWVVEHAGRILAQSERLGRLLADGIAARSATS